MDQSLEVLLQRRLRVRGKMLAYEARVNSLVGQRSKLASQLAFANGPTPEQTAEFDEMFEAKHEKLELEINRLESLWRSMHRVHLKLVRELIDRGALSAKEVDSMELVSL